METMMLKCLLSDDDLQVRREQLLSDLDKEEALVEERKDANKDFAKRAKLLGEAVSKHRSVLRQGYEMREVEVEHRRDERAGLIRTVRLDTGEEVSHRAMTALEKQGDLFDEPAEAAPTSAPARTAKKASRRAAAAPKASKASRAKPKPKAAPARRSRRGAGNAWDAAEAAAKDGDE